ncbi:nucleotide sugar dehydrogenase [Paenibacillus polymyxa]|uniref:nucleotide sugar dehydrogenase n=1 Tax=Paenibacillus polymyxa TaxID=1406 RepID=UPI00058A0F62|nr:nucleotide sugar dehydrogenase [Paenibacillus polymyxa]AJE52692.1 UDP-N-acetyl-D-glucosamine dehydrogenase [Paenibacillus polymyxa]QOH63476.1 nucleotide sugar dehydrogenase [Paenibacillus polymyxa]
MKEVGILQLMGKITKGTVKVAVIGLGYVGLPMAVEMAQAGYDVYGVDSDPVKVAKLLQGKSYIIDIGDDALEGLIGQQLHPVTDIKVLEHADIVVICVPTPLTDGHQPDTSYIETAIDQAIPHLRRQTLLILESTTYPGTTEELIRPVIEQRRGWTVGKDFYVCFSPERVDPGSVHFNIRNTPKVIGGCTPDCLAAGAGFYGSFLDQIVPVSSTTVAEAAKLFENTFRSVNIGMVNELTAACEKIGINIWEVLDAAATKPFGYMPFYPGPGIGGHCIPVDPLYLSWKSEQHGFPLEFVDLADRMNRRMPLYIAERIESMLAQEGKTINKANIILAGVAYKKDIDDVRESPALVLFEHLTKMGASVSFTDPYVSSFKLNGEEIPSRTANAQLWESADIVVITTDHSVVNYQQLVDHARLVFDTRNATAHCTGGHVVILGHPGDGGGAAVG